MDDCPAARRRRARPRKRRIFRVFPRWFLCFRRHHDVNSNNNMSHAPQRARLFRCIRDVKNRQKKKKKTACNILYDVTKSYEGERTRAATYRRRPV